MFSRKENSKTVGIFDGKEKKVFVHCAKDIIIDHSLEIKNDGEWFLYCLTKKGDLYRVGNDLAEQCARKSSRHESEQIEIFSDLLGLEDSNEGIQLTLSSQPVYILNEGDVIQRLLEDPIRLCISTKHTIIVARQAEEYVVHLFEKTAKGTCSGERIARLPKKCLEDMNNSFCKVLVKVVTCLCIDNRESVCPCDLKIDTRLFKQLFGEETALLNSPVILICLDDGSVYFMRMSSLDSEGSVDVDNSLLIVGNNSWTLLCHMSSVVRELAVITVQNDKVESSATGLCVCCEDGQITIFLSERKHLECSIWDVFITSPVVSICPFRNRLYYISGHSLFESTVAVHHESIESQRNKKLHISQTKVLDAKYLAFIHTASADRYVESQDSPCLLHCSCQNGEVKLIETSLLMDSNTESSLFFKDSLKHILTSIDSVDEKRHKMKIDRKIHEKVLKQLSIASYLIALNKDQQRQQLKDTDCMNNEERNEVNEPSVSKHLLILVQIRANAHKSVENELTEISVEVTNQMPVALSSDWTLTASLCNTADGSVCFSTAMKIENSWKLQEKNILPLPATYDDILAGCKLVVKATLITDSLVSEIPSDTANRVCISCTVYEGGIDVLDCLLPPPMKMDSDEHVPQYISKLNSHIRKQAHDRNSKLKPLAIKSGIDDVTVHSRHEIRYSKCRREDKISEAERRLLREVHGSIPVDINNIQPSNYKLFTTVGHSIHFSVLSPARDRTSERTYGEVLEDSFELTVRSTPRIAAAVNRAIRHRETRMIHALGNHVAPEIRTNCAQKAVHAAQELLSQLRCQQIDKATLTSAFQNLRNIQL